MKYLYRIVNALLAVSIFPAALFLDFIIIRLSTTLMEAGLEESLSLWELGEYLTGKKTFFGMDFSQSLGTFTFPEALEPSKAKLIAAVVGFAMAIIAALFVLIWSICSNKRLPIVIGSAVGIISVIVMTSCFHSVTSLIVNGTVNVVELFTSNWIVSLIGGVVNVDMLGFAGFQNGMIIIFVAMLIWTAAFWLVEIGEPKEEKPAKKSKK